MKNNPFKKSDDGKMLRKKSIAIAVMVAVLTLAVFTVPALADYNFDGWPVVTQTSGSINGTVFIDSVGWTGAKTLTLDTNVPDGTVKWARLYTGTWGGTENYEGWVNVTFNDDCTSNGLGPIHLQGKNDNNPNVWCTGHGKYWWWYNVTNLVEPGSTNNATNSYINGSIDGRVYGIVLVVVLKDDSKPPIQYWINNGSDALNYVTPHDTGITDFAGAVDTANLTSAFLTMVHLTAYEPTCNNCLEFNGNALDTSMVDSNDFELNTWNVKNYVEPSANDAWFSRGGDQYVNIVNGILVLNAPVSADLTVSKIEDPMLPDHDYTLGVVANHAYKINATIKNTGNWAAGASTAALHANDVLKETQSVPSLAAGEAAEVQFTWTPTVSGTYKLNVTADALDEVTDELDETNNVSSKDVEVLATGTPDLAMTEDDLIFMPTYAFHSANNKTTFQVNISNIGTGDANNFNARAFVDGTPYQTISSMTVKAKGVKVISFDPYNAAYGTSYDVKMVLDADGTVSESNEGNNETTRTLNVIRVRIRDTHHWGDNSTCNSVDMFDVVKLVPANTTAWDALNSVAVVKPKSSVPPENTFVYGIDGLDQDASVPIYWYLYMNGRYVPVNYWCDVIELQDGETLHWDFQKQVYVSITNPDVPSFTPASTVQSYNALSAEPFTHGFPMSLAEDDGFSRTIWNTTIVYPAELSEYSSIANNIRDELIARCVPSGKISIASDTSVMPTQKENNNLILLGTYTANDIIAELNPYHEYFGMVIYNSSCELFDDSTDNSYTHGEVVQAFDNPYDNGPLGTNASFGIEGPVILMASGLNDGDAKDSANLFIAETDELNMFWRIRQMMCGDVDASGGITIDDVWYVFDAMFGGGLDCCTGCRCAT
jgi:subtilase family serine protease